MSFDLSDEPIGKLPQDFESVAKRPGADESKERFEAKLGKIAKAKQKPRPKKSPR